MSNAETGKEVSRLAAIVRIHHSVGATLDLGETARILVRELFGMLDCGAAAIMMIEGHEVKVLAEKGFSKTFGKMKFTQDVPAIKHIVSTRQSIFTGNVLDSPAAGSIPYGCFMCSLICVPVMVGEQVRGIIHLDSTTKDAFSRDDLEFAELLAKEMAIAIERSILYSKVVDVSIKDGLTGCYNRRKFDLDIVADVAESKQGKQPLSLLMLDIDWFKNYNDSHGHPQGDELLRKLVTVLTMNLRPLDGVYRYGGEEFAVLLHETGKVKAVYTATRLRGLIEKKKFEGEEESQPDKKVTISLGVATFPVDVKDWTSLIKSADSALYQAKETGKNKVCAFNKKSS